MIGPERAEAFQCGGQRDASAYDNHGAGRALGNDCVLPDELQVPALRELRRVVKPGGLIRLLEYVRPQSTLRRIASHISQPWINWAYGASFDRHTGRHVPAAGLELLESRYVVDDLLKLLTVRVPYREAA